MPVTTPTSRALSPVVTRLRGARRATRKEEVPSRRRTPPSGERAAYRRWPKPPYTYKGLIATAIMSECSGRATLALIYQRLMGWFPFFSSDYKGWMDSVRHNLSNNKCFKKVLRDPENPAAKSNFWSVDVAEVEEEFLNRQETSVSRSGSYAPHLHLHLGIPTIWELSKMSSEDRRVALLELSVKGPEQDTPKEEQQDTKVAGRKRRQPVRANRGSGRVKKARKDNIDKQPITTKTTEEDIPLARDMDMNEGGSSSASSDVKMVFVGSPEQKEKDIVTGWLLANADGINQVQSSRVEEVERDRFMSPQCGSEMVMQTAANLGALSETPPNGEMPHLTELTPVTTLPPTVALEYEKVPGAVQPNIHWAFHSNNTSVLYSGSQELTRDLNLEKRPNIITMRPILIQIPEDMSYPPMNETAYVPNLNVMTEKPCEQATRPMNPFGTNLYHLLSAVDPAAPGLDLLASVALTGDRLLLPPPVKPLLNPSL